MFDRIVDELVLAVLAISRGSNISIYINSTALSKDDMVLRECEGNSIAP